MARILIIGSSREEQRHPGDEETPKGTLRIVLEKEEHEINEVSNAIDALELAGTFEPDIIFIAYRTMLIVSTEAIRMLRENPTTHNIPIVMATTMKLPLDERDRITSMCDAFLELPGTPGIVQQTVRRLLGQTRPRILFLDDNEANSVIAERVLRVFSDCTHTTNGADACVRLLNDGPFDLLITDVCMKGSINGIGLAGIARAIKPELPIIFMTGGVPDIDIHSIATILGVSAVIEKPCDPQTFTATIKAVMESRKK